MAQILEQRRRQLHGIQRTLYRRVLVGHLPLLILREAQRRPINGYAIISTVMTRFGILLSPGTVYPILQYLAGQGLLKEVPAEAPDSRSRYFQATVPQGFLQELDNRIANVQIEEGGFHI